MQMQIKIKESPTKAYFAFVGDLSFRDLCRMVFDSFNPVTLPYSVTPGIM